MLIPDETGPRGDATVSSFVRPFLSSWESQNGRVIDRSAIIRRQNESAGLLVSLRYQYRAIASSRRMKYGVRLHKKKEEKKEEKEKDADFRL